MDDAFSIAKYRAVFPEEHGYACGRVLDLGDAVAVGRGLDLDDHADDSALLLPVPVGPGKALDGHSPDTPPDHPSEPVVTVPEVVQVVAGTVDSAGRAGAPAHDLNPRIDKEPRTVTGGMHPGDMV